MKNYNKKNKGSKNGKKIVLYEQKQGKFLWHKYLK